MIRERGWLVATLLVGVFMGALDIFIVAPALGAIQTGLQIPARLTTWSFTAYTLVLVVTQPFVAKLSDLYGRRGVYAACIALFGAGSALCATSHAFGPFIVGRCVQAIGAGGIMPVAMAVIADVFPEEKRGAMLGLNAISYSAAFLLGPIIGGVLVQGIHIGGLVTDWHTIFLVNLPLTVIVLLMALRTLPARPARRTVVFDWNGMALLTIALFLLVFGLTHLDLTSFFAQGAQVGLSGRLGATLGANLSNEAALPLIILGLAFFVPFVLHEMQTRQPIVDVAAFGRKQLVLAMCLSLAGGIITSSVVYVPQLVESARGLSAGAGGFYLFYVALTLFLGAGLVGRLIDRYGSRAVMFSGGCISVAGFVLLLAANRNLSLIIVALLLMGAGLATVVGTPLRYIVSNEADPQHRATSLAVLTICSCIGQTIILPVGGALISSAQNAPMDATAPHSADATQLFNALHGYYALILVIALVGVTLAAQLKTRRQELADREIRQRMVRPHPRPLPILSDGEGRATASREPAMSAR